MRELLAEARSAAQAAHAAGGARVELRHLNPIAGSAFSAPAEEAPVATAPDLPFFRVNAPDTRSRACPAETYDHRARRLDTWPRGCNSVSP